MLKKAILQLETLTCPTCIKKIEGAIKNVEGVDKESVKVLFNTSKAKMDFDASLTNINEISDAVQAIGYEVQKSIEK